MSSEQNKSKSNVAISNDKLDDLSVNQDMFSDLSSTAQAFRTRFKQKKSEQAELQSLEQEASKKRNTLLIQTVSSIRKSLIDVTRLDLGDRFYFELVADDWNGWPRIVVKLIDKFNTGNSQSTLQVTAHDRHSSATIEISYSNHFAPECISLLDSGNIERLPVILKRCVRTFLDTAEEMVLVAENSMRSNGALNNGAKSKQNHLSADGNLDENLFEEQNGENDVVDSLVPIDEIEALPGFS